jgi:hypothetical protein
MAGTPINGMVRDFREWGNGAEWQESDPDPISWEKR